MTEVECWDDDPDFASDVDNASLFTQSIATTSASTSVDDGFSFDDSISRLNSLSISDVPSAHSRVEQWNQQVHNLNHELSSNKNRISSNVEGYEDDFSFDEEGEEGNNEFNTLRPNKYQDADVDEFNTIRASETASQRPPIPFSSDTLKKTYLSSENDARYPSVSDSPYCESEGFSSFEDDFEIDPDTDLNSILHRKQNRMDPKASFSSVEQSSLRTPSSAHNDDGFWDDFDIDFNNETESIFRKKIRSPNTINQKHPYISSTISYQPNVHQDAKYYPLCKDIFPSLANENPPSDNPKLKYSSKTLSKRDTSSHYPETLKASSKHSSPVKGNSSISSTWTPSNLKIYHSKNSMGLMDLDALKTVASNSKYRTKPKNCKTYGDGTELDTLDELPVDYEFELKLRKKQTTKVSGTPKSKHTGSTQEWHSHTTPRSTSKHDNNLNNITNSAKNEHIRSQRQHKTHAAPSKELTKESLSNDQLSVKEKRRHHKKAPTLIQNLNSPRTPKIVGKMRYNPAKHCWEGNDYAIRDFDTPISPSRPALISNISTKKGIQVVGNMVYDPTRLRWIDNSISGQEAEDPFSGFDDLEDTDSTSQYLNENSGSFNGSINSIINFPDMSEIYDVGPEFEKKQFSEDIQWRKRIDGWFFSFKNDDRSRLWELYNILNAEQ
ncbi:Protein byr4 [Schizosaccharomyces pombe]